MNAPLPTAQLRQQLYREMDPLNLTRCGSAARTGAA